MKPTEPARSGRFGIGSGKQYYVFRGPRAAVRLTNTPPEFEFYSDPGRVVSDVYLFKFEVRSDRRKSESPGAPAGLGSSKYQRTALSEPT